jgi:hypothetical protein
MLFGHSTAYADTRERLRAHTYTTEHATTAEHASCFTTCFTTEQASSMHALVHAEEAPVVKQ